MTDEPALKPEARIVSSKPRSMTVALDHPVEFDGTLYESVTIRRVTGKEVDEFIRASAGLKEGERQPQLPVLDFPREVYDEMDDDDRLRVEEALLPFLPRRLTLGAALVRETSATTSEQ
ncbi:phage tail assembly protein [Arvimicrobium flavum]|uniref:phage tail assembly protein n=1 Tax=Arvimicrobium flavum TaxID=3393320 RepID=UPI00237A9059|nr:phage tail assembly protein [Mesorhizobium shangrilense]